MGIGGGLFHTVTALVDACTKHVSRATRKLRARPSLPKLDLARGATFIPFISMKKKKIRGTITESEVEFEEEEGGVWRRGILMGEKCQPLDFSGAIYYDNDGRRLMELPTPRSLLQSPRPSSAIQPVVFQSEKVAGN